MNFGQYIASISLALVLLLIGWYLDKLGYKNDNNNDEIDIQKYRKNEDNSGDRW